MRRLPISIALGLVGLLVLPPEARADEAEKTRCASAYERAQELQRTDALTAARKQLVVCTETCPERLRRDCASWIRDVDTLMPTIVLRPRDESGRPLQSVRVTIDGELLAEDADLDKPLAVDPGAHVVGFEHPDSSPAEVKVTVHGGERGREIAITLWRKVPPPAPPPPARPPSAPGHRTSAYVFGIGGLVALAAGGSLGIAGDLKKSRLASRCAPFCAQSEADGVVTLWEVGAVTAAVGAAALAVGAYLWFTSASAPSTPPSGAARTSPGIWASLDGVGGTF